MFPEYRVVACKRDVMRTYYTHKYYDAVELFQMVTRELPYAELWEGNTLLQTYDSLGQLMA